MNRVLVIGGGAAGLMAACAAAAGGAKVTVLERNEYIGRKILITGKGRCNVTNACSRAELIGNIAVNGKFMYSALAGFDNRQVMEFFETRGCALKTERGGRVFPVSDSASSIVGVFANELRRLEVEVITGCRVDAIVNGEKIRYCSTGRGDFPFDKLVVATGGLSYPGTGSTGDGYLFAEKLDIRTEPRHPALVPVCSDDGWVRQAQGLSLRNVRVTLLKNGDCLAEEFGEMLFTHFGLSGPVILTLSRLMSKADFVKDRYGVEINLKPALTPEQLDARLVRDFSKIPRKMLKNGFTELLPRTLIEPFVSILPVDSEKQLAQISRAERQTIAHFMQHMPVRLTGLRPVDEAIVTSGGIAVRELDPKTMRCRKYDWLYFAGEIIDVDACTGGFNLQIAFSTGYVAGKDAALRGVSE